MIAVLLRSRYYLPLRLSLETTAIDQEDFIIWSGDSGSTTVSTQEDFVNETYRLQKGVSGGLNDDYDDQADIAGGAWVSANTMNNAGDGYDNGLLIYNSYLISPAFTATGVTGHNGDFRSVADVGTGGIGGSGLQGPAGNPDYRSASLSVTDRAYYRYFTNASGGIVTSVGVTITGVGTIVPLTTALSAGGNVHVEMKLPDDGSGTNGTGWLDCGSASLGGGNISDGDGCYTGSLVSNLATPAANTFSLNGEWINDTEKVLFRISAHKDWTGYITQITTTGLV